MAIRKDSYLKKLNNSNLEIPTPITREEKILSELAGVNGLGIELPTITSQDDGKVLKVSNGTWILDEGGGGGSSFDLSDRLAKGVDDNGNVIEGAIIEGCLVNNPSLYVKINKATGLWSHAEGTSTTASGKRSHAEGASTTASGQDSHAEGFYTIASGQGSHAEGDSTTASGVDSHAEGISTIASDEGCHAEGSQTKASGYYAHAEGNDTEASGDESHAEGSKTIASGQASHAEGNETEASGDNSHAEGICTIAASENQHVEGKYNVADEDGVYAHIIGNGTSKLGRSNAFAIKWDGTFVLANGTEITPAQFTALVSGGNEFIVTISESDSGLIADKTFNEIFEAKQANKSVYMIYKGKKNHVVITSGSMGMFDGVASVFLGESNSGWATGIPVVIVKISTSDQVTETYKSLTYGS